VTNIDTAATAEDWKNTILAGLANYIDAGSIVSGSAALALWAAAYNLSTTFIGVLGAFSANAICAGVGALVGGRLCDLFGRKKIYQYDMLFYAFGMLWLVFAMQPWMIVVGFILVGLAVGADIPASWSLIAELAPSGKRGKHSGSARGLALSRSSSSGVPSFSRRCCAVWRRASRSQSCASASVYGACSCRS
jgi:inositol transporter-like SP family MFS transporter